MRSCTVAGAGQVAHHPPDAAAASSADPDGVLLAAALCPSPRGAAQHEHQWHPAGVYRE